MKRATIKDIANIAGVNVSTVSRALKDHSDIGLTLRNKIKKIANDLNYHPNLAAVQLRKQKSKTIGLILPDANMYFIPSVISGIADAVKEKGYRLLVLQSWESYEQEVANINICNDYGIEGLLMSITHETTDLEHLKVLESSGISVVMIDKVLENTDYDAVLIDDTKAPQVCLEYLIKTGCTRILGMMGNANLIITQKRLEGFNHYKKNIAPKNVQMQHAFADNTFAAWDQIEAVFENFKPNGIFSMSDEITAGVIPALRKMKIDIPKECAVIGISDGYLPRILDPQVTHLHHDGYSLGKMAAEHLISKLTYPDAFTSPQRLILPTQLIIKDSTL